MKTYQRGDSIPKQAQQVSLVLVSVAVLKPNDESYTGAWNRGLLTYGALAKMMGKSPQAGVTLTRQLGIIGKFCEEHDLPALNSIVVNKRRGQPGDDVMLATTNDVEEEQSQVSRVDSFSILPPTISQLRRVYECHPELRYV